MAQQSRPPAIPATSPTASVSNLPSAQPARTGVRGGAAEVTWTGAQLTVRGSGQSLAAVLQQVARLTGMKVTGGAPAEPVFGSYGPGPAQEVLAQLFDGLAINMLLVNGSGTQPKELVLTARTGGPTPPQQQEAVVADETTPNPADANTVQTPIGRHNSPYSFGGPPSRQAQAPQQDIDRGGQPGPAGQAGQPGIAPGFGSAAGLNGQAGTPVTGDAGTTGAGTTDANGTPQSPNGVRTPEQIFEELRKRQAATNGSSRQ